MLSFWRHVSISSSPILRATLKTNAELAFAGKRTWFSYIMRQLKFLSIDHIMYTSDLKEVELMINSVKGLTNRLALEHWSTTLGKVEEAGGKLELFCKTKRECSMSHHLSASVSSKSKLALSRIRMSAHNLPVETLRYSGLSREQRVCPFCCEGVGNEVHYFTECSYPFFAELQAKLYESLHDLNPDLRSLNKVDRVICMLNSQDPRVISRVGDVSSSIMTYFKELNTM